MLTLLYLGVKAQWYVVSSSSWIFLDEKTLLKVWLNPGLKLTIFRGNRALMGKALIYKQILLTNSSRKCVEISLENFVFGYWGLGG